MTERARPEGASAPVARPVWLLGGTAVVLCVSGWLAVLEHGAGEEAVRAVTRATAQIAVVLFALTFATSSLHAITRSRATKWLLRNRRYLGLSFALAHTFHLLSLALLAARHPQPFMDELDATTLIGGGLAYAFLFGMAATSSDAAVRKLGARSWRRLHTIGSYYLWTIFAFSYIPLAAESVAAVPYLSLLVLAMGLRVARRMRTPRRAD